MIADWTTAGPYHSLSWLTIIFTVGVVVTLVLSLFGLKDAWKTYKAVLAGPLDEGLLVLSVSTLLRSAGRVAIQVAFLVLACAAIYVSVQEPTALYWYRVVFILSFLLAELVLSLSVINDLIAKRKVEEFLAERSNSARDT